MDVSFSSPATSLASSGHPGQSADRLIRRLAREPLAVWFEVLGAIPTRSALILQSASAHRGRNARGRH